MINLPMGRKVVQVQSNSFINKALSLPTFKINLNPQFNHGHFPPKQPTVKQNELLKLPFVIFIHPN